MDHQSMAQLLGNYGEFIGAIAVVLTLAYLARQVTLGSTAIIDTNVKAKASAIHDSNELYVRVFTQLAYSEALASIYHRALTKETLGPVEAVRFQAFVNTYFAWLEECYAQTLEGLAAGFMESKGKEIVEDMYPYWHQLLDTESGTAWWTRDAIGQYTPDFITAVNEVMRERGAGVSA